MVAEGSPAAVGETPRTPAPRPSATACAFFHINPAAPEPALRALPRGTPSPLRMETEQRYTIPTITVILQPQEKTISLTRPKTVLQLLDKLGIRRGTALVIRDGELLTQDRAIQKDDVITVRIVTSSG